MMQTEMVTDGYNVRMWELRAQPSQSASLLGRVTMVTFQADNIAVTLHSRSNQWSSTLLTGVSLLYHMRLTDITD